MIKLSGITAEADREFFQRGGCESVRVEGTQGQRKRGGRSVMVRVRVRVRVMFEYVHFLHFDFRGINLRHYC